MRPERQLGLLWGGVAALLVLVSPLAPTLAARLPDCLFRAVIGLPCLTCGTTRAALALSRFEPWAALALNPLATLAWIGLIAGGLVAGFMALIGRPLPEPAWSASQSLRWSLVAAVLFNWLYLLGTDV